MIVAIGIILYLAGLMVLPWLSDKVNREEG